MTRGGLARRSGRPGCPAPHRRGRPHQRTDHDTACHGRRDLRPPRQRGTDVQPLYLESIAAGGDCAVLRIAGEVDVSTAPDLRERVIHLVDNGACTSSPICAR